MEKCICKIKDKATGECFNLKDSTARERITSLESQMTGTRNDVLQHTTRLENCERDITALKNSGGGSSIQVVHVSNSSPWVGYLSGNASGILILSVNTFNGTTYYDKLPDMVQKVMSRTYSGVTVQVSSTGMINISATSGANGNIVFVEV